MSSSRQFALCALLALVFVDNAFAYPQIRAGLSGSWLLAYASNSEGKSFTCNYYTMKLHTATSEKLNKHPAAVRLACLPTRTISSC